MPLQLFFAIILPLVLAGCGVMPASKDIVMKNRELDCNVELKEVELPDNHDSLKHLERAYELSKTELLYRRRAAELCK